MEDTNNTIPVQVIRKQLRSLLNYEELKHSQVLSKFLEYIVEETLSGRQENIKEYTIGTKALGRAQDFNPQIDAAVRIHAGRLRKIISFYYLGIGNEDRLVIDIPKGAYIPRFVLRNDLPEDTFGEKLKEEEPLHYNGFIQHSTKPVLAILPLQNLSGETSIDKVGYALYEQLTNDLAKFSSLSLMFHYTATNHDVSILNAMELQNNTHVDYILTGSIHSTNGIMRVNLQLIRAINREIVWTESYHCALADNTFELQEEILNQAINVIADDNGIISRLSRANAVAGTEGKFSAADLGISKYLDYTLEYEMTKIQPAVEALEKAVEQFPTSALPSALLAHIYVNIYLATQEKDQLLLEKAQQLARTAVSLDPHSQPSHKALAWSLIVGGNKERGKEEIEYCISLNPKAGTTLGCMGLGYICMGEFSKGYRYLAQSSSLSQVLLLPSKIGYALYHFSQTNFAESKDWFSRIHPIETPFITLFNVSLSGKLNEKTNHFSAEVLSLADKASDIIGRFVKDQRLNESIMDGLRLAGMKVN